MPCPSGLVQLGALAVLDPRLAGRHPRLRAVLSDRCPGNRHRHHLLLGRAHGHRPADVGCAGAAWRQAPCPPGRRFERRGGRGGQLPVHVAADPPRAAGDDDCGALKMHGRLTRAQPPWSRGQNPKTAN